jgi:hypothetical protein
LHSSFSAHSNTAAFPQLLQKGLPVNLVPDELQVAPFCRV